MAVLQRIRAFSTRLRQQVDLDALAAELLGVVEHTMQPTSVSLWLRPSGYAANGPGPTCRAGTVVAATTTSGARGAP